MKKVLYIGQCEEGSTSRMRYLLIEEILGVKVDLINISNHIISTRRPYRSIGWRYKIGPLIKKINSEVLDFMEKENSLYDLIWLDKAVFLTPKNIKILRAQTVKLVHFTPDPAFLFHRSRFFLNTLKLYDNCITTKSFELNEYMKYGCKNLIFCTQGYDEAIHKPFNDFDAKKYDVCFIGHFEKNRAELIQNILDSDISVVLAGIKWEKFVKKNKERSNLYFVGSNVVGEEYSRLISESRIGLGLLSKWIPEKHTTRTFEIPACGTALLTEDNSETRSFFKENEAIFYDKEASLPLVIKSWLNSPEKLKNVTHLGMKKIQGGNYTYLKLLRQVLTKVYLKQ